jgi:hypothetical protein
LKLLRPGYDAGGTLVDGVRLRRGERKVLLDESIVTIANGIDTLPVQMTNSTD